MNLRTSKQIQNVILPDCNASVQPAAIRRNPEKTILSSRSAIIKLDTSK